MSTGIRTDVEIERFALSELEAADYNPRQITPVAMRGLTDSLRDLGLLEMPVVNVHGGKKRIVSGHQRVKAMLAEGTTHADCVVVRFDAVAEMAANLTMNNHTIRGSFNARKALPMVEALSVDLPKPDHMGFDALMAQLRAEVTRLGPETPSQAVSAPSTASNAAPDSQLGRTYRLGAHRLLCGSCTDLPKLFGKARATACITDPPYGVAYEQAATGETLANDDLQGEAWTAFLADAVRVILKVTSGPCYVFMSSQEIPALDRAWREGGGHVHRWLFWAKDRFTLSRGDYHHMHEPCLHGSGSAKIKLPEELRTNVLEFPKPAANALHPTQKPLELIRALMQDSTLVGDLVAEPFAGSGTTLAVAEEMGRVCYASELDPKHCDTIRRRWAEQVHGPACDWRALTPASPFKKK